MISSSVRKSLGCILLGCMVFLYGCGSSGAAGGTVNHDHPSNGWFARPYKGTVPASA